MVGHVQEKPPIIVDWLFCLCLYLVEQESRSRRGSCSGMSLVVLCVVVYGCCGFALNNPERSKRFTDTCITVPFGVLFVCMVH